MDDDITEITDGDTTWRFDQSFLSSNWTCIWAKGCLGILPEAMDDGRGCCSIGAELDGEEEAMDISALASMLAPDNFQHHGEASGGGIFSDGRRAATRVVDGACIFLNRPGFAGGAGCALHIAALKAGDSPMEWKPSVCSQLPIKVDYAPGESDTEIATVRGWTRADWGAEGKTMAWCCTEGDRAFVGTEAVVDSMGDVLSGIVGERVYVELRRRITERPPTNWNPKSP